MAIPAAAMPAIDCGKAQRAGTEHQVHVQVEIVLQHVRVQTVHAEKVCGLATLRLDGIINLPAAALGLRCPVLRQSSH